MLEFKSECLKPHMLACQILRKSHILNEIMDANKIKVNWPNILNILRFFVKI